MKRLTLYSRPGCHLCEELLAELEPLLGARAVVEHVDVGEDPELERLYGHRIPVLAAGAEELSEYPLDRERVERYLAERA